MRALAGVKDVSSTILSISANALSFAYPGRPVALEANSYKFFEMLSKITLTRRTGSGMRKKKMMAAASECSGTVSAASSLWASRCYGRFCILQGAKGIAGLRARCCEQRSGRPPTAGNKPRIAPDLAARFLSAIVWESELSTVFISDCCSGTDVRSLSSSSCALLLSHRTNQSTKHRMRYSCSDMIRSYYASQGHPSGSPLMPHLKQQSVLA